MGNRHQCYVIARVKPRGSTKRKYRCVAAWHHQFCGVDAANEAVKRFLTTLRVPENLEVVREELLSLDDEYPENVRDEPEMPVVPCPYISRILGDSWDTDMEPEGDKRKQAFGNHQPAAVRYQSGVTFVNSLVRASCPPWRMGTNLSINYTLRLS